MEVVIAVLILIGAMVAGSTSLTSDEDRTESALVTESEQTTVAQSIKATPGPCRLADGRVIQRDLTVPRASTAVMSKANPEEAGHGCADH